eukprot:953737-Prorocentrum_lima.AAC.1
MTSSLVGSEMCIRDRADVGCQYILSDSTLVFRAGNDKRPYGDFLQGKGCLLYTSDAADDM